MSRVTGWVLLLAWAIVALGLLGFAAIVWRAITTGPSSLTATVPADWVQISWWLTQAVGLALTVACIGTILGSRRLASLTVVLSLLLAGLQLVGAATALLLTHRISLPISAALYLAFAIGLDKHLSSPGE